MNDEEMRKLKAEGERREAQLKKEAAEEMKVSQSKQMMRDWMDSSNLKCC